MQRRTLPALRCTLAALALAACADQPTGPALRAPHPRPPHRSYVVGATMTDLGVRPGAGYSFVFGINDQGTTVGSSAGAIFVPPGGPPQELWPGTGAVSAHGINELNHAVGGVENGDPSTWRGVMGDLNQILAVVGFGGQSAALDINEQDHVVGYGRGSGGNPDWRAFLWSPTAPIQDLGILPGGVYSYAAGVNDNDAVVGWVEMDPAATVQRAFLWTSGGGMMDLGDLGGGSAYASDINNNGQVSGASRTSSGDWHAFRWSQATGMVDLGTLPGGVSSFGWGIGPDGTVVGEADAAGSGGSTNAFVWTPQSGMVNLRPSTNYSGAYDVNATGVVAGEFADAPGTSDFPQGPLHAATWQLALDDAPTLDAGQDRVVVLGRSLVVQGHFTDANGPFSYTVDWGDGTSGAGAATPEWVVDQHSYAQAGSYAVTLCVTDGQGAAACDALHVTVRTFPAAASVAVDVMPGTSPNVVQFDEPTVVRVALLATAARPAAAYDAHSFLFGGHDQSYVHPLTDPALCGGPCTTTQDVNGDGRPDLVLTFDVSDLFPHDLSAAITPRLTLVGRLTNALWVAGRDNLTLAP